MKILLETTEWKDAWVPNHVYVLNDSQTKILAYVPAGSKTLKKFSSPQSFDRRGRTFVELTGEQIAQEPQQDRWEVPGSNGKTYTVTRELGSGMNYQCTCPGFLYRGSCRPVAEFQMNHNIDVR
jgi:uncharacterized Zn finger protein